MRPIIFCLRHRAVAASRPRQAHNRTRRPPEPDQNTGISSLDRRPGSTSASAARATATARTRRATSAIAICATGCFSRTFRWGKNDDHEVLGRSRDPRRLSRSAVRGELQQLREDEGVVRLQPDPALLQPGHAHHLHDDQRRRPQPGRLPGAGAERRRDERDLQHRRDRLRPAAEADHHRLPLRLQPDATRSM